MCCPEFIAKYVLFIANLVFSDPQSRQFTSTDPNDEDLEPSILLSELAGLAIIRLGVAVLRNLRDLQDILPVNALPIGIIVLGCIIFIIAFLACCGAIKESRCMLITYSIFMVILVAVKIYLAIVVFGFLSDVTSTITSWVTTAFNTSSLRDVYHVMEALFNCCGTTGPSSYDGILSQLPPSCCASPVDNTFYAPNAFPGCTTRLIDYFDTFARRRQMSRASHRASQCTAKRTASSCGILHRLSTICFRRSRLPRLTTHRNSHRSRLWPRGKEPI
ncbi:CD63 antigen isoform X9 [Bombyx mori]|uniref:CD63 antigen isoform X9 n=1 Tax=Bombyx mori TaxID=7091 RepID=UPI002ED49C3C